MALDLASIKTNGYSFGLDNEKLASLLEQMASGIRTGLVVVKKAECVSVFSSDEFGAGRLVVEFNEKEVG